MNYTLIWRALYDIRQYSPIYTVVLIIYTSSDSIITSETRYVSCSSLKQFRNVMIWREDMKALSNPDREIKILLVFHTLDFSRAMFFMSVSLYIWIKEVPTGVCNRRSCVSFWYAGDTYAKVFDFSMVSCPMKASTERWAVLIRTCTIYNRKEFLSSE
jgi:hypothetical protein